MTSLGNIRMTKAGPKAEPITTEQGGRRKAPMKSGRERSEIKTDDASGGIVLLAQHSNGDTSIHLGNYE